MIRLKFTITLFSFAIFTFFASAAFANKQIFVEPNDSYAPVINQINAAHTSIDMAMYLLKDHRVINALINAKKRGVKIRIILEKNIYSRKHKKNISTKLKRTLSKSGILVKWSNPAFFSLTHEKAFAIDHKSLVIMTLNQTYSAYHFNREYGVIDDDIMDLREFENIFQGDWNNQYRKVRQPNMIWSPNNASCKLIHLIQSAKKSLRIESEELKDKMIENLLIQKAQAGVNIQIIMPPQKKPYAQQHIIKGGVHLRILNRKNKQLYMHAKMIIADGQQAYIGSENLSSYSLQMNRELGMLINRPDNILILMKTFAIDWKQARLVQ